MRGCGGIRLRGLLGREIIVRYCWNQASFIVI